MEGRMTLPHIVTFDHGTCGNILNDPEREITSMKLFFLSKKVRVGQRFNLQDTPGMAKTIAP